MEGFRPWAPKSCAKINLGEGCKNQPGRGLCSVEIKIRERALNPTFPDKAFTLEVPAGYRIEPATCDAPN